MDVFCAITGVLKSSHNTVSTCKDKVRSDFSLKKEVLPPKVGRPSCLSEEQRARLLEIYHNRSVSLRQLAELFGMSEWRIVRNGGLLRSPAHEKGDRLTNKN